MTRRNPWFRQVEKYANIEADLLRKQYVEMINIFGIDVKYVKKTQDNLDKLFGEDQTTSFNDFYHMTVLPEGIENYNTGEDLFSKFGMTSNYSITLYIEIDTFKFETNNELEKPQIGDLIYIPIFDKYFEISYNNTREDFFTFGQRYLFKIEVTEFRYSHETISTGDTELDINVPTDVNNVDTDNGTVNDLDIIGAIEQDLEDPIDDDEE